MSKVKVKGFAYHFNLYYSDWTVEHKTIIANDVFEAWNRMLEWANGFILGAGVGSIIMKIELDTLIGTNVKMG